MDGTRHEVWNKHFKCLSKGKALPLSLFVDTAVLSEELGYDGFFIPDHYNLPRTNECTEPYTTLAYIAVKTNRIMLGTTWNVVWKNNISINMSTIPTNVK